MNLKKIFSQLNIITFVIIMMLLPVYSIVEGTMKVRGIGLFQAVAESLNNACTVKGKQKIEQYTNKTKVKQDAISYYNYILFLLGERKIKNMLIGQDGWMVSVVTIKDCERGRVRFDEVDLINEFSKFTSKIGVPHLVVSVPRKHVVYPEKLGLTLKQSLTNDANKYRYLDEYIDILPLFLKNKDNYPPLFSKFDHHPDGVGTYLYWEELTKRLHAIFKDKAPSAPPIKKIQAYSPSGARLTTSNAASGGLGPCHALEFNSIWNLNISNFNVPFDYHYVVEDDMAKSPVEQFWNFSKQPNKQYGPNQYECFTGRDNLVTARPKCPATKLKAFIYGNSMANAPSYYYSRYFEVSLTKYYSKNQEATIEEKLKEHIDTYNQFVATYGVPDVVIGFF